MTNKQQNVNKGFTLIEVLLALAILSVSMVVLLSAASKCLAVLKVAKKNQGAQWVLGMGEVEHPFMIEDGIEDLNVDEEEYGIYIYEREVLDEDDEDDDDLYEIKTRVSWSDRGKTPYIEVVRYVYYKE